ncbi:hypothetical protein EVAR_14691_1 [Eumeta japonica]|uniref:Uncharacterized protein n=1 Tax=Eumeta variegata TaxID=151549 RepID=A0A4C1U2A7_EUMVA|nr:hypothetical protein EVAR_14691_1 [Eumeta japonica]
MTECLVDSIESQCSHASSPHDILHIQRLEEKVWYKAFFEPKDDLPPIFLNKVQTLIESIKTRSLIEIQYFIGIYIELPTIAIFMKDASKRFFDITESHPNARLLSAASFEPLQPYYFIHKPRNILTDPPDAFTATVESILEVNDSNDKA